MSRAFALAVMVTLMPLITGGADASQKDSQKEMVAVVSSLSGEASVMAPPDRAVKMVQLFDWLSSGSVVKVPAGSRLTLAFANGSRYEMGERSGARLFIAGPNAEYGAIRRLDPVPPIPRLALMAAGGRPGPRAGGIVLRAPLPPPPEATPRRISFLYPRAGTAALPDSTVLRFSSIAGAASYAVALMDRDGRRIFENDTESAQVPVPAGVLEPGARYSWSVTTVAATGPAARGDSEFVTLPAGEVKLRAAFKARMEAKGDAESLALLAEIDRRLGLLLEAMEGFKAALAKSPSDPTIRRMLQEVEDELLHGR